MAAAKCGMLVGNSLLSTLSHSMRPIGIKKNRSRKRSSGATREIARRRPRHSARRRRLFRSLPAEIAPVVAARADMQRNSPSEKPPAVAQAASCAGLLSDPGIEALGQTLDVVHPELGVDLPGNCQVLAVGGKIRAGIFRYVFVGIHVGDAISHVQRQLRLALRVTGEGDEFIGLVDVGTAGQNYPVVDGIEAARPDDLEVSPLGLVRDGQATIVGAAHYDFARGQELQGLGAGLPPDDLVLDLVKLGKGAFDTLVGFQDFVKLLYRYPVREERELESVLRAAPKSPLARKLLQIPAIGPALGSLAQVVAVIGQHRGPDDGACSALMLCAGDQLAGEAEPVPVERLVKPFLAADHKLFHLDLNDVPIGGTAFNLGTNCADAAIPDVFNELFAGFLLVGFEVDRPLRVLIVAAPRGHREGTRFGNPGESNGKAEGKDRSSQRQTTACEPRHSCAP